MALLEIAAGLSLLDRILDLLGIGGSGGGGSIQRTGTNPLADNIRRSDGGDPSFATSTSSDIQITGAEQTDVPGQLIVTYTEDGATPQTIVVNEYTKTGPNELTTNEYRVDDGSSVTVSFEDKEGNERIKTFDFNFDTGAFTTSSQTSTDSAESSAVTDLYDFRWAYNSNGEQVLLYRPKGDETDPGTVLTPDADGGSLAENERSTMVWNSGGSSSSYKVNIGGTTYSVPVGVIEVVTATTWGLSGENIQNNEGSGTLIATDSTTTTTAANLTTAVASAFADTGPTIASGINTADTTPPTTLATT
ncbi:MAG: hypothetical protein ACK5UY_05555 [Holosporales bacterium]